MILHEMGKLHGTDKWDRSHTFLGESYLDVYERYLEPLRGTQINVLELGVRDGNSLRLWKEYFPKANIFGIDFNPRCKEHDEERIEVLIASQDDKTTLNQLAERVGGFNLILDDASHINHLTRTSFEILFPVLRAGGFYIIEDLGMSWVDYNKHLEDPSFMEGVLRTHVDMGVSIDNEREDLESLFRRILFAMDMNRGEVRYVHFWSKIVILQKAI